jgi:hypothetical protein
MQSRVQKALAILFLVAWRSILVQPWVIARDAEEQTASSTEACRRLRVMAKSQSLRVAIKVRGKILFINLGDLVAAQAKGKCV